MREFNQDFTVDLTQLDKAKKPGISAILRLKNGEEYLRETIESHIEFFDEIIACHNGCTDSTVDILKALQCDFPDKIRIFEYSPDVYAPFSDAHNEANTQDVRSLANFYNYTLSKVSYSMATKLDDDHIAISKNFSSTVKIIRSNIVKKIKKIYTFSGVNLARSNKGQLGIPDIEPLVGTGDHMFFPVCSDIYFEQVKNVEAFKFNKKFEKEYVGILYFHLKYLKKNYGFSNLAPKKRDEIYKLFSTKDSVVSLSDFLSEQNIAKLRNRHNPVEFWLRTNSIVNKIVYSLSGKNPPLRIVRLARLKDDLQGLELSQFVPIK